MEVKLRIKKKLIPIELIEAGRGRLEIKAGYHPDLVAEVKMMQGAKWHGYDKTPRKIWSIADSQRNRFQLDFLTGKNVYAPYDAPLVEWEPSLLTCPYCKGKGCRRCGEVGTISPYAHQVQAIRHILTRRHCILGAEMGTGKTLAAIKVMEEFPDWLWYWVGPRSALEGVKMEFDRWAAKVSPRFFTYEGLKSIVSELMTVPQGFVIDEASRAKNPQAQRSKAVADTADKIRERYGRDSVIVEMSGTPAPKSPSDWWHLSEIACPGFLKEGSVQQLTKTLAIVHQKESISGGVYPQLVSWRDDDRKCEECGKYESDANHDIFGNNYHVFRPTTNEVARLYRRLKGLVEIQFKRDCLDLPEKRYEEIHLTPKRSTLNAAEIIKANSKKAIQALTLLRELSDGFQYKNIEMGEEECTLCRGTRQYFVPNYAAYRVCFNCNDNTHHDKELFLCPTCSAQLVTPQLDSSETLDECPNCEGEGRVVRYGRNAVQIETPKEGALINQLSCHEDVGRLVIYAGFEGSVSRCVEIAKAEKWDYIRVDGKGWKSSLPGKPQELLKRFQYDDTEGLKITFIGQPSAAGMGLTLTASPSIVYWSNDFNAESRIQSEDRIHRPGMDLNRGATIIDLLHLPVDAYILENLRKKRRLQDASMGEISEVFKESEARWS